jgi:endonuclease/exonuclease/phosphatase family metal-dependent hydrolase
MKNTVIKSLVAVGLMLAAACADNPSDGGLTGPTVDAHRREGEGPRTLAVMSRNMYVGADVDAVIGALASPDPADDLPALQAAIATLGRTDFPARARAIADEIARNRPDVIGLQEVSQIHVDLNPIGMPVTIDQDFLPVLMEALAQRHLRYVVAAKIQDTDASPLPFIRLTDWDVLLVDARRVRVEPGVVARNFAYNIGVVAPGVDIKRGYIVARATVDGLPVTIVNTHLESGSDPQLAQLRAAQAIEVATVIGDAARVVLLGDLNDTPGSAMHQVLAGAGLVDVWPVLRPRESGMTCCHVADLSNPRSELTQRIDYVWQRGLERPHAGLVGQVFLLGVKPGDRVQGPAGRIWPSDHAGVVAEFVMPREDRPHR